MRNIALLLLATTYFKINAVKWSGRIEIFRLLISSNSKDLNIPLAAYFWPHYCLHQQCVIFCWRIRTGFDFPIPSHPRCKWVFLLHSSTSGDSWRSCGHTLNVKMKHNGPKRNSWGPSRQKICIANDTLQNVRSCSLTSSIGFLIFLSLIPTVIYQDHPPLPQMLGTVVPLLFFRITY